MTRRRCVCPVLGASVPCKRYGHKYRGATIRRPINSGNSLTSVETGLRSCELISNGFYAATKRKGQATGDGFEPTLRATTKNLGDRVEITIRDNGIGIPPEVREKMFNPFFTTKPAGEGTGLGLSISHDIIVKQHAGSIEVETEPGEFTEFKIVLPRVAALLTQSGGRA